MAIIKEQLKDVNINDEIITNVTQASNNTQGTIALGYTDDSEIRNYPVQVDDEGKAYVFVPWYSISTDSVVVDNVTIKKDESRYNALYVNKISTSNITDISNYAKQDDLNTLSNEVTTALSSENVQIGKDADSFEWGVAIGSKAKSQHYNAVAIGGYSQAKQSSVAVGSDAVALTGSVAIGYDTHADSSGIAIGSGTWTPAKNSIAIGQLAIAGDVMKSLSDNYADCIAIGSNAAVNADYAVQFGDATNIEPNSFKFKSGPNGNVTIVNSDGVIPISSMQEGLSSYAKKSDILKYASQIILDEDVEFVGDYTLGVKKTTIDSTYTVSSGTSLLQLLKDLFTGERPDAQPVLTQPSITLTLKNVSSRVKVGETITPGYEITFNPGKYTTTLAGHTKEQETNVSALNYSVTFNGQTLTTQSGTFNPYTPTSVGTLTFNAIVTHSDGDYAKTYNGITTTQRIEAGSKTDSKSITVYEDVILTHFVDISSEISELSNITDDNIKTKARYSYTTKPTKLPYDTTPNCGLAIYVKKSENVNGIKVGKFTFNKKSIYDLTNYNCFIAYDDSGLILKKDSDISYS